MDPGLPRRRQIGLRRPPGHQQLHVSPAVQSVANSQGSEPVAPEQLPEESQEAVQPHVQSPTFEEDYGLDLYPTGSQLPPITFARAMEGFDEQPSSEANKRPRIEDEGRPQGPRDPPQGASPVEEELLTVLATVPPSVIDELRKCLSRMHSQKLDNTRQITKMQARSDEGLAPHGWKMQTLHLPSGSEVQEAAIKEKLMEAYSDCYKDLISIDTLTAQMKSKIQDVLVQQMQLISTVISGNPSNYRTYRESDMRELVQAQLTNSLARAELDADLKAAKAERARAMKAQKMREAEEQKREQQIRAEQTVTVSDMQAMMDAHRNEMKDAISKSVAKVKSQSSQSLKKAGKALSSKSMSTSTAAKKKKGKQAESRHTQRLTPVSGGKGKGKGKGAKAGKGKTGSSSSAASSVKKRSVHPLRDPTYTKQRAWISPNPKSTIVNLTNAPLDPSTEAVLSLGPKFRPTPAPLSDERVTKAVRSFAKGINTSAFFALNPEIAEDRTYDPRLYAPTGRAIDPKSPALENTLIQYDTVITAALTDTTDTHRVHNLSKQQRDAFFKLKNEMHEGTSAVIPLMADKDSAFVTVTPVQHEELWLSHLKSGAYTLTDPGQIEWESIRRETVHLANQAVESGIISRDEYRFIVKDCRGQIRHPRGSVMVKTHKPMDATASVVSASRLYLDTVNYLTTAWAKFLSVKLTPARDKIVNRVKDTADFISRLQSHRFDSNCWLVTMDIVDFYPNTKVSDGEEVIKNHIPTELVDACIRASRLIHKSIYVLTPCGIYKLDGRYGIGLAHSGEVCDLDWSRVEQSVLGTLPPETVQISLPFWARAVDDYFMILQGPTEYRNAILDAFKEADPDRPLTVNINAQSVDYLDVTVYKGHRFYSTGILDTKSYTKPSYTGMHLHHSSHHPTDTFISILSGYHNRSLVSSSDMSAHTQCMNNRVESFLSRGYPINLLISWLLQATTTSQQQFEKARKRILNKKRKCVQPRRIVPLKLPFTPRTSALSNRLSVQTLQKSIQKASPALSRASLGKLTLCNLKTPNVLDISRPRGFLVQVRMAGTDISQ